MIETDTHARTHTNTRTHAYAGNGRCRGLTGKCECYPGFSGDDCSVADGGGTSDCEGKHAGPNCQVCTSDTYSIGCDSDCDTVTTCSGNGRCNAKTGGCLCYAGFEGTDCRTPVASICEEGFSGPSCQACTRFFFIWIFVGFHYFSEFDGADL